MKDGRDEVRMMYEELAEKAELDKLLSGGFVNIRIDRS